MSKVQTRRTVSLGRNYHTRLLDYAKANLASAAQVTEYALDRQLAAPLDQDAFRSWRGERARKSAIQGVVTSEAAHPEHREVVELAQKAREERRAARVARAAELAATREARSAERAARKERRLKRAAIRAEHGRRIKLCWNCDGHHATRFCPDKPYVPIRTGSRGEQAARAVKAECITTFEAGKRFGISHQAVSQTWKRLFPGETPPMRHWADRFTHEVIVEMVKQNRSIAEIVEETGYSAVSVSKIARRDGLRASAAPGRRAAMESAITAVANGATIADAVAEYGVSYGRLADNCRERGIEANKNNSRDGRALRAADLVQRGAATVSEAARQERCAPAAVHMVLRWRAA